MRLLINYVQAKIRLCFPLKLFLFRVMALWFGRLPLLCRQSRRDFALKNLLQSSKLSITNNQPFALFLCLVLVDCSNHYTKAVPLVIIPVLRTNCCLGHRVHTLHSRFGKPKTSRLLSSCLSLAGCFSFFGILPHTVN